MITRLWSVFERTVVQLTSSHKCSKWPVAIRVPWASVFPSLTHTMTAVHLWPFYMSDLLNQQQKSNFKTGDPALPLTPVTPVQDCTKTWKPEQTTFGAHQPWLLAFKGCLCLLETCYNSALLESSFHHVSAHHQFFQWTIQCPFLDFLGCLNPLI